MADEHRIAPLEPCTILGQTCTLPDCERPCDDVRQAQVMERVRGHVVPLDSGGTQIEWHQDGWDVEIEFTAQGVIDSVFVGRSPHVG